MARERDNRRQKLYDAERDVEWPPTMKRWGERSVPEIQKYVDKLTSSAWFKRRWPRCAPRVAFGRYGEVLHLPAIRVRDGRGHTRATGGYGEIQLPMWSRKEWVVLHEVAHNVTPSSRAAHGWEFCQNYLALVQHQMGKETADALRAQFKKYRVRYTKPRAKRVLTDAQRAELRDRLANARAAKAATRRGEGDRE